jgi:hypothetical protein
MIVCHDSSNIFSKITLFHPFQEILAGCHDEKYENMHFNSKSEPLYCLFWVWTHAD